MNSRRLIDVRPASTLGTLVQLKTLHETLDDIAQEQLRMGTRVEQIAAGMERPGASK